MGEWNPPQYNHLIEEPLQSARVELLNDSRVYQAMQRTGSEAEHFLQRLLDEKLFAAASTGLDAVESSLRVEATEVLLNNGYKASAIREIVKELGNPFFAPPAYMLNKSAGTDMPPLVGAILFFAITTLISFALFFQYDLNKITLVVFVACGIMPAYLIKDRAEKRAALRIQSGVREYPALICRHYLQIYEEAYENYRNGIQDKLAGSRETPINIPLETQAGTS